MILGVCGKIAAGKSALAAMISAQESFVIDRKSFPLSSPQVLEIDHLAHLLFLESEIIAKIAAEFGQSIIKNDQVDRSALSAIVFSDPTKLTALEHILHPLMLASVDDSVQHAREHGTNLILVAALPRSFRFDDYCDEIIFLPIKKQLALERVKRRNPNLTLPQFEMIWQRQAIEYPCPLPKKKRQSE